LSNIIDYVKWRGDLSFEADKFNEVDSLVFSELSYIPYEQILVDNINGETLESLADKYFSKSNEQLMLGAIMPEQDIRDLFKYAAATKRFGKVIVKNYINTICKKREMQFSAMCFVINKETVYIAFRGTDDSIIGWKENLNMSYNAPIPSQIESTKYLDNIGLHTKYKLYLGGHSKGGNLAAYSAIFATKKTRDKILSVHSFDGPGFRKEFLSTIEISDIKNKIIKILPSGSVIGMIYDPVNKCKFIESNAKGINQHNSFSWEVLGNKFVEAKSQEKSSREAHRVINNWTNKLTPSERAEFVEAFFKILTVNNSETLTDIASKKFKFFVGVIKTDGKTKRTFTSAMNKLLKEKSNVSKEEKIKQTKLKTRKTK
jgi:hypothetical protein